MLATLTTSERFYVHKTNHEIQKRGSHILGKEPKSEKVAGDAIFEARKQ